jgi:hypothetical protein
VIEESFLPKNLPFHGQSAMLHERERNKLWRQQFMQRFIRWSLVALGAVLIFAYAALFWVGHYPFGRLPGPDRIDQVVYLDQGWGPKASSKPRQDYYYSPRGTSLQELRYSWFVNLENVGSSERFASPENLRALGFVVDTEPTPLDPDRLPLGFARRFDQGIGDDLLDITCAACHTGELHYTRTAGGKSEHLAVRIDGGSAMSAFTSRKLGQFMPTMIAAMVETYVNPFKFTRFSQRVLGDDYDESKGDLSHDFAKVLTSLCSKQYNDWSLHLYPVEEGFGRTDAMGRMANQLFATKHNEGNYRIADAPVSFPPVWNVLKSDWSIYTASAAELPGGGHAGLMDWHTRPLRRVLATRDQDRVFRQMSLGLLLKQLQQPQWPTEVFGAINTEKAEHGRVLYRKYCASCHEPCEHSAETRAIKVPLRPSTEEYWSINEIWLREIGTDPASARNSTDVRVDLTSSEMTNNEARRLAEKNLRELQRRDSEWRRAHGLPLEDEARIQNSIQKMVARIDIRSLPVGSAINLLGMLMRNRFYTDNRISLEERKLSYGDEPLLGLPQVFLGYEARPLGGIWATPLFFTTARLERSMNCCFPQAKEG